MNSADPIHITGRWLLLVEGRDEELFFGAFVRAELPEHESGYQVIPLGRDGFRRGLRAVATDIRERHVEAIGVVRDADEHPDRAFQGICDALKNSEFDRPDAHGKIVEAEPRIGVFVMPDGKSCGALESLCRRSVTAGIAGSCTGEYLDCLDRHEGWGGKQERNTAQRDKALTHAFLASQKDPVARVGEGALQGIWDFQHEAFREIWDFLLRLASMPANGTAAAKEACAG